MQKHPSFDELIEIHYQPEGELADSFRDHVNDCGHCHGVLEQMSTISSELSKAVEQPSRSQLFSARARFIDAALKETEGLNEAKVHQLFFRPITAVAAVAACLLVALGLWMMRDSQPLDAPDSVKTDPTPRVAVAAIQGRVLALQGEIRLIPKRDAFSKPLTRGDRIEAGNLIQMKARASLFAELGEGNQVMFNEASLRLARVDSRDIHLDLAAGSVAAKVSKLKTGQSFIINSPDASVAVQGTHYAVATVEGGGTLVAVREGKVLVTPHSVNLSRTLLEAGETLRIGGSFGTRRGNLAGDEAAKRLFSPAGSAPSPVDSVRNRAITPPVGKKADPLKTARLDKTGDGSGESDAARLLARARKAQRSGKFSDAIRLIDQLLRQFPQAPEVDEARYFKGENLLGMGDINGALAVFESMEQPGLRQDLAQNVLYTRGYLLQDRLNRPEEARRIWRQYIERYPEGMLEEEVSFALCRNLSMDGKHGEAFDHCSGFSSRNSDAYQNPQAVLYTAEAAFKLGKYAEAAEFYGRYAVSGREEQRPEALYQQGASLLKLGKTGQAAEIFRNFLRQYPKHELAAKIGPIIVGLGEEE